MNVALVIAAVLLASGVYLVASHDVETRQFEVGQNQIVYSGGMCIAIWLIKVFS